MNKIDFYSELYSAYCLQEKLPCISADEHTLSELSEKQQQVIIKFIEIWNEAQATEAANVDGFLMGEYNELEGQND